MKVKVLVDQKSASRSNEFVVQGVVIFTQSEIIEPVSPQAAH